MQWPFSIAMAAMFNYQRVLLNIPSFVALFPVNPWSVHSPGVLWPRRRSRWWPVLRTDSDRKDQEKYLYFTRKLMVDRPGKKHVLFIPSKIRQTRILNPYKPINLVLIVIMGDYRATHSKTASAKTYNVMLFVTPKRLRNNETGIRMAAWGRWTAGRWAGFFRVNAKLYLVPLVYG